MKSEFHKQVIQENSIRGFLPYQPENEAERVRVFLADTSILTKMAIENRDVRNRKADLTANRAHLNKILEIIEICNEAGIHCVFLLHPKQDKFHLMETIPIEGLIPENHLIDISDPDMFPELFLAANSISKSHFNIRGTRIFTNLVAEKFQELHAEWLKSRERPATNGR